MYQNLINKDVIARKEHRCDWCRQTIKRGEKYNYQTFIFDGDWGLFCSHSDMYHHLGKFSDEPCGRYER